MEWLAAAEFAYNDKKHATTGKTPFELNFGRHPWKGDLMVQMELPRVEEFAKCDTSNGRKPKEHEKTVQQKKKESSRSKGWRTCVAGKQKYPVKSTLKEVGQ